MGHPNNSYKAYKHAAHTVSKTRQVVMLYDGAIRFLQQAGEAIENKDYELRFQRLSRVSDIIIGLQSCLDFDSGGSSARILFDFYTSIDQRIFNLHRSNDPAACQAIIADIKKMRDAWDHIDRGASAGGQGAENNAATPGDPTTVSA